MSSRSKEKVAAVLRKIFKGGDKVADASSSSSENKGNAAAPTNTNAASAPTGDVLAKHNNNKDVNANGVSIESPGKRMRRDDYKISPAPTRSGTHKEGWCQTSVPTDSTIRARRLMKEFKEMQRVQKSKKNPEFTVELINDNLYEWYARLLVIDPDSKLAKDMVEMNIPHILLHLVFPDNFPFAPPFMRVVEPRIEKGFVMEGGAICMELLTPRGWASAYTVEAVLMQFSASLVKGQGRIVRKSKGSKDFTRRSAEQSFRSLVKTHEKYGWVTPSLSDG